MATHDLSDIRAMFPSAPSMSAQWAPIYFEPMHGSGERFVVAVAAQGTDGASLVRPTIERKVLRCMYGAPSEQISGFIELLCESIEEHFAAGGQLAAWEAIAANCSMGAQRVALGNDLDSILSQACRLTASLSKAASLQESTGSDVGAASVEVDYWLQRVKRAVHERMPTLEPRFNSSVRLNAEAPPVRIGYNGAHIVANFDALVPGRGLADRRQRAKARIVDLQIVRDVDKTIMLRESYELMLWVPNKYEPSYDDRQIADARSIFAELEEFGDLHELRVVSLADANAAAERILTAEGLVAG